MEVVKDSIKSFEETKQEVDSFLNDPEHKKKAVEIAYQIKEQLPNWFTIPKVVKKFKTVTEEAAKKIEMLMLFNICIAKVEKDIPYFKIDLDHRTQRELLSKQIEEKEGEILFLKEKLSRLD
jgi:hypothetical protein